MSEQRDFVDFNNGGDTGQANLDSIQPLTDGEGATQVVLRRPAENIRSRTEILRDEVAELKHYRDYGQMLMEYPSGNLLTAYPVGTVNWGGPTSFTGPNNTGVITASGELRIAPFLAPKTGKKGSLITGDAPFDQMTYTVANAFFATQGMNAITVEHRNGGSGTTLSASISDGPVKRILVLFDIANTAHDAVAVKAAVDAAIAADADLVGAITVTTNAALLDPIDVLAETRIEGTADDELHTVTGTHLSAFTGLDVGDGIAIWYRYLVEPTAGYGSDPKAGLRGGRAESSGSRGTSAIPSGSLFKTSASASKIPGAIPICRVAYNGQLVFADGTKVQPGETITFASATSVASAALTAHISNLATTNGAGIVGFQPATAGNWAEGAAALVATNLQAAVTEIVSDLAATTAPSGALHIGVDAATIFSGALTAAGGGGAQSADTTTRAALDRLDSSVVARRAFTAVCTDNSTSTGGDINTADVVPAINTLAATGGTYLLRRGAYNVSTDFTTAKNTHLIGEDVTKVALSLTKSGPVTLFGSSLNDQFSFENIFLKGHVSNTYAYVLSGGAYTLRNCRATAGAFSVEPAADMRLDVDGLVIDDDTLTSANTSSILLYKSSPDTKAVTGTIRRLRVTTVPSGSNNSIEKYGIWVNNIGTAVASKHYVPLVFENAVFDISAGFGDVGGSDGAVAYFNASHQPQIYRDCVFRCSQVNASITPIILSIVNSTNITFENCTFTQDGYGKLLSITGTSNAIRFKQCKFYTSTLTIATELTVLCDGLNAMPVAFEECELEVRAGDGTLIRRIEIGLTGGTVSGTGPITIDGLNIILNYASPYLNDRFFLMMSGSNVSSNGSSVKRLRVDLASKQMTTSAARAIQFRAEAGGFLPVEDLTVSNIREADNATVADNDAVLINCNNAGILRGHLLGAAMNTANPAAWAALVQLDGTASYAEKIRVWSNGRPNQGRVFRAVSESARIMTNTVRLTNLHPDEATEGWFCNVTTDRCLVNGNNITITGTMGLLTGATEREALVVLDSTADHCVTSNNIFYTVTDVTAITTEGGYGNISCNTTHGSAAGTLDAIVVLAGNRNTLVGNTGFNVGAGGAQAVLGGTNTVSVGNNYEP